MNLIILFFFPSQVCISKPSSLSDVHKSTSLFRWILKHQISNAQVLILFTQEYNFLLESGNSMIGDHWIWRVDQGRWTQKWIGYLLMKALSYCLPSRRENSLWAWLTLLNWCINNTSDFLICHYNDLYTVLIQDLPLFLLLSFKKRSRNDSPASLSKRFCA